MTSMAKNALNFLCRPIKIFDEDEDRPANGLNAFKIQGFALLMFAAGVFKINRLKTMPGFDQPHDAFRQSGQPHGFDGYGLQ